METDHYAFMLVIEKKYWNRLCQFPNQGRQIRFFVRKNQVGPKQARKLLFYVKKPHMQVLGSADFVERITGDSEGLWNQYGLETFFENPKEYKTFAEGREKMTFIEFENFSELKNPKPKEEVALALGSLVWFRPKFINKQTADTLTL